MQRRFFFRFGMLHSGLLAFLSCNVRKAILSGSSPILSPAAVLMAAAFWLGFSLPAEAAQQLRKGHVPTMTKGLPAIGRMDGARRLNLAIGLPLRNGDKLTNLLHDLYQPANASFRHYLKPDEFASSFGPSQEDYQAVADFAKAHGLTIERTHRNRTLLDVSGSVADIEKAFHIKMQVYQHPTEGRTFFAPDVEPSLDLATPVLAISGLDNYTRPRPMKRTITSAAPAVRSLGGGGSSGGNGGGGSGAGGTYLGYDFRAAYAPGVTLDGTGQYVGLFELSG